MIIELASGYFTCKSTTEAGPKRWEFASAQAPIELDVRDQGNAILRLRSSTSATDEPDQVERKKKARCEKKNVQNVKNEQ